MCLLPFFLLIISPSLSAPVPKALLTQTELSNGQLDLRLPPYILELMTASGCFYYWHINDTVVASEEGFIDPVLSASADGITTDTCHPSLVFHISCPSRDFDENLRCSCVPMKAPGELSSDAYKFTVSYSRIALCVNTTGQCVCIDIVPSIITATNSRVAGYTHHYVAAHSLREIQNFQTGQLGCVSRRLERLERNHKEGR